MWVIIANYLKISPLRWCGYAYLNVILMYSLIALAHKFPRYERLVSLLTYVALGCAVICFCAVFITALLGWLGIPMRNHASFGQVVLALLLAFLPVCAYLIYAYVGGD